MAVEKESKIYNVSLITYCPLSFVETVLKNHVSQLKAFSYCLHDRDKDKEPHIHIIIISKMPMLLQTYINWFKFIDENDNKVNTFGEKLVDIKGAYQYLLHLNSPEKYQYDEKQRKTFNTDFFELKNHEDKSILALTDILAGCSLRDCALRYGRDFIYHYAHMRQLIIDIEQQEGIVLLNINKK